MTNTDDAGRYRPSRERLEEISQATGVSRESLEHALERNAVTGEKLPEVRWGQPDDVPLPVVPLRAPGTMSNVDIPDGGHPTFLGRPVPEAAPRPSGDGWTLLPTGAWLSTTLIKHREHWWSPSWKAIVVPEWSPSLPIVAAGRSRSGAIAKAMKAYLKAKKRAGWRPPTTIGKAQLNDGGWLPGAGPNPEGYR